MLGPVAAAGVTNPPERKAMNRSDRRAQRRIRRLEKNHGREAVKAFGHPIKGHLVCRLYAVVTPGRCYVTRNYSRTDELKAQLPPELTWLAVEELFGGVHGKKDELCVHAMKSEEITLYEEGKDRGFTVEDSDILHTVPGVPVLVIGNADNTDYVLADCPCCGAPA
jgi:hypothetical protein